MKTSVKQLKTNSGTWTKALLAASILAIGVLPTQAQDLVAIDSGATIFTQLIEKPNLRNEPGFETSTGRTEMEELHIQELTNEVEYHPLQFVEAEFSLEMQHRENGDIDESLNLEESMKIVPYNAGQYVENEMRTEAIAQFPNN